MQNSIAPITLYVNLNNMITNLLLCASFNFKMFAIVNRKHAEGPWGKYRCYQKHDFNMPVFSNINFIIITCTHVQQDNRQRLVAMISYYR